MTTEQEAAANGSASAADEDASKLSVTQLKEDALLPVTPPKPCEGSSASSSQTPSVSGEIKKATIKFGYLFKQSTEKWKPKKWNQRWFVLDHENKSFKYFRQESLIEAVPFRQDAHGVLMLKPRQALLMIQGDLPKGVPTPFCFTVSDGNKEFRLCADTSQEFKEWTNAIAAVINPMKRGGVGGGDDASGNSINRRQSARALPTKSDPAMVATMDDEKIAAVHSVTGPSCHINRSEKLWKPFLHSSVQGMGALLLLNPAIVVMRSGNVSTCVACIVVFNALLVWYFFLRDHTASKTKRLGAPAAPLASGQAHTPTSVATTPLPPPGPPALLGQVNGVRAAAGASTKVCAPAPEPMVNGCWTQLDATRFNVRKGPNYRKTRAKAPSDLALIDLIAVDIFRSPAKIDNVGSLVDLSALGDDLDLIIVNCQVPCYPPSNPLWGERISDGIGFNLVTYFAIPKTIRAMIDQPDPPNPSIKLLKKFMEEPSEVRDRFKAIGIVANPQEQNLGRTERHILETYNGQPILTRPQHRFYHGAGYFEVDVDAHLFNYIARKSLLGVSDHFPHMVVDFGFVLEGQEDAELPERILGCVRLCKIDVTRATELV